MLETSDQSPTRWHTYNRCGKVRDEHPISLKEYMRGGIPVTLLTMIVGVLWLQVTS